ncbi:unnamed protein product [Somion occarium]|uniref:histone deacetylase n=1 Tax=Somion occarium TaxID=3059160 RepID=A0ABP1DGG9_9APHY
MADGAASSSMEVDGLDLLVTSTTHAETTVVVSETDNLPSSTRFAAYNVGYVYDPRMMLHSCSTGHQEDPDRISRIFDTLKAGGCIAQMVPIPIREIRREEVLLVHSESLWDKVMAISSMTEQDIADSTAYYDELSLYAHPSTPLCARLSCGGVVEAALAVARGQVKRSFAIVRPPGHHAEPDEHMGFCFFNNVAVAVKVVQLLTPIRKILILDWDIHHGNGTQRAFYDDPSVLYISLHRYDGGQFYPNGPFGSMVSCGEGPGLGYSVNIPWPQNHMGDADYIYAFQHVIMPIAMEFTPQLVIISSGFDAAKGDELGECDVTPAGYSHMTHMLTSLANGRVVVALEGGYDLEAISNSALAVTQTILGEAPQQLDPMVVSEVAAETIWQVALEQSKHWKNINPKACDPLQPEDDSVTFSIPELLKAHRQDYLYRQHEMLQVPFAPEALDERFSAQAACTADVMDNQTLVVFIHELGNLRVELDSVMECNVQMEHSYMIDMSKDLIGWVKDSGYALLDINVLPKPFATKKLARGSGNYPGELMTYIWDNYIEMVSARRVVLIGHGPGCEALMYLISHRTVAVMRMVTAVVQVVGHSNLPATPRDAGDIMTWYHKRSLAILPANHRVFTSGKVLKRHGNVLHETKPIRILHTALPTIYEFIQAMLDKSSPQNGTRDS